MQNFTMSSKSSWVSSSFDDFLMVSSKCTTEAPSTKKHKVSGSSTLSKLTNDELWANKYTPRNLDDLAVNKKKVAELQEWFEKSLVCCQSERHKVAPILLLTGPSGVGKSVTVRLVAAQLHVDLKEWTNQAGDHYSAPSFETRKSDFDEYESQTSKFSSFLFRANRYPSLVVSGNTSGVRQHIVLIEDIPNVFTRNASSLHDLLRRYRTYSLSPLVFILTDQGGASSDYVLFPKSIQAELGISTISFNPVAPTVLIKVLTKITAAESASCAASCRMPDRDTLQLFVDSNRGDLRASINALQFYCRNIPLAVTKTPSALQPNSRSSKTRKASKLTDKNSKSKGAKKSSKEHTEACETAGVTSGDGTLSLFHAVGKILHCKRDSESTADELLAAHLQMWRRNTLLVDPEDVVSKVCVSKEHFIAFLHQNYVDFHTDLDEVVVASDYLSDCDQLTCDWVTRSVPADYGLSVALRGLLFSTPNASSCGSVGWKPLHKAQWFDVAKVMRDNCAVAQDLFSLYRLPAVELATQQLPFIAVCTQMQRQLSPPQAAFVRDVIKINTKYLSNKAHLERFSENDYVETFEDMSEFNVNSSLVPEMSNNKVSTVDSINNNKLPVGNLGIDLDDEFTIEEFDD